MAPKKAKATASAAPASPAKDELKRAGTMAETADEGKQFVKKANARARKSKSPTRSPSKRKVRSILPTLPLTLSSTGRSDCRTSSTRTTNWSFGGRAAGLFSRLRSTIHKEDVFL